MTTADSRRLLPVLFAPVFMVILDVFIVNVAAPSLRADLGASEGDVQWVVAAYLLAYAATLVTGGRLGDVVGRRRMFRIGVAGFTVASALCAAAPSAGALIAARVVQGVTGAVMWPQVLSIIQVEFPPEERPKAFGVQGFVQGLASIAGQIVGGALISLDLLGLGWRWVFLVNLPVGVAASLAAGRVPESRSATARRLDLAGVALGTSVLLLVMFPAVEGRELGWPLWAFAMAAASVPLGAAFVALERRIAARGGAPLVELGLFRARGFRVGASAAVVLYFVVAFFLLMSIYLQDGLGLSPIESGVAFTPLAFAFVSASLAGPRLPARVRAHLPHTGAAIAAVGLVSTAAAVDTSGGAIPALVLAPLPVGIGMGLAVPALINLVLHTVPAEDAGAASGMLTTAQQVGNALGVALVGTAFFAALGTGTGSGAYGDAFVVALGIQAGLALAASALLHRARERAPAVVGHTSARPERAVRAPLTGETDC